MICLNCAAEHPSRRAQESAPQDEGFYKLLKLPMNYNNPHPEEARARRLEGCSVK
jgi:hypothetical protein